MKNRLSQRIAKLIKKAEKSDWGLVILKADDGFVIRGLPEGELMAFSNEDEKEDEPILAMIDTLRAIVDYFGVDGSKYVRRRILIDEIVGEKYFFQDAEELRERSYHYVRKKNEPFEYGERRMGVKKRDGDDSDAELN